MKKLFILLFALGIFSAAQAQEQIFPHGLIPVQVDQAVVLGPNPTEDWNVTIVPTDIPYHGEPVTVQYPEYRKPFNLRIKGQQVTGEFAIRYERFNDTDFLMFQIYIYWQNSDFSWFIAKAYGDGNMVKFYESDPETEATLKPGTPVEMGGPYVWRLELMGFTPFVDIFYDLFLEDLKDKTRDALIAALENRDN